ncbi:hypothetical protein ACLOJK_036331, partial [Asimina triloba]
IFRLVELNDIMNFILKGLIAAAYSSTIELFDVAAKVLLLFSGGHVIGVLECLKIEEATVRLYLHCHRSEEMGFAARDYQIH